MSLWSVSVPDEAMEQLLGQDTDFLCMFGGLKARLWYNVRGKYHSYTTDMWNFHTLTLQKVFRTRPPSGVDLWRRAHQLILEKQTQGLQADKKTSSWQVQQPERWYPTFRWEGEDWIKEADRSVSYNLSSRKSQFLIPLKIAEAFGFMKWDPVAPQMETGTQSRTLVSRVQVPSRRRVLLVGADPPRTHSKSSLDLRCG